MADRSAQQRCHSVHMHLASDYIHPTPRGGRCRIRIYLSEESQDAPVVICSELVNNGGTSFTYAAEQLAAEVIRSHRLPTPLVWIEHWPQESTDGGEENFELVVFSSYKVEERAPYLGGRGPGSEVLIGTFSRRLSQFPLRTPRAYLRPSRRTRSERGSRS